MKTKLTSAVLLLLVIATSSFTSSALRADIYKVDTEKSTITWEGKKFAGSHNGTIKLKSGVLNFNGKKLTGGGFVIDMASIKDADKSANLEGHLKADDFFGVATYPDAKFTIKKIVTTGADAATVTGDLTLKGITNPVTFPAKIAWNTDGTITATAEKIAVDRTKYGIKFKSKSSFPDIGDKFIYDEFELNVKLIAKK
jgi:polyisoprenoid-binding protein YceI